MEYTASSTRLLLEGDPSLFTALNQQLLYENDQFGCFYRTLSWGMVSAVNMVGMQGCVASAVDGCRRRWAQVVGPALDVAGWLKLVGWVEV